VLFLCIFMVVWLLAVVSVDWIVRLVCLGVCSDFNVV